jgi:hypothetical protein
MPNTFQALADEFICYGCMVATRGEVYSHAFDVGVHNAILAGYENQKAKQVAHKWADSYAFGPQAKELTPEEASLRITAGLRFNPRTGEPAKREKGKRHA